MAEQPALSFAGLLRQLRGEARMTQEELAEAANLSSRSISDLERGVNLTARKDTAVLLTEALGLTGTARELFVAAARGRAPAGEVLAARDSGGAFAAAATRSLPHDIASFTGRAAELAELLRSAVDTAAAGGGVVGIHAIGGMAGVGKTAFAVHAAHKLTDVFPDGQFFLPLHAHTPGQRPVDPADALASLLLTAGLTAQQIPSAVEARAGLWRDHLAGKKVLLLLDDAAGHEQVTPLLPGTAGSLVLVTSRRHLTALQDAVAISLDTLHPREAAALLARLSGRPNLSSGTGPGGELTRLCGYLPLAIGMLARQLYHHPSWTAASLAADLAVAVDRLELMRAENLSVTAAFDLSYQDLTAGEQRLFRRLGQHPGPNLDEYAAAALDGTDLATVRRHLDGLYNHYLLAEPARGRYSMHDLLREHAGVLAAAGDPADSNAAASRLLDYYLHTALAAGVQVATWTTAPVRPPPGDGPALAPQLATAAQASAWLETERPNLHAAARYAAATDRPRHAVAIASAISGFLFARGYWDQATTLHQATLATARQAGDRTGQADTLSELGILRREAGEYPAAADSLTQALELYRNLDDRLGQASALDQLGTVQSETGDCAAAAASHRQAIELYRGLGHRMGQGMALKNLGAVLTRTGDYPAAAASCQQALGIFRDVGHRIGQAMAVNNLGLAQSLMGDYPAAAASYQQALAVARDLGHRPGQAIATANLGEVQRLTGDYAAAAASQQLALDLYRDLGHPMGQALALNELGTLSALTGDHMAAAASMTKALGMFRDLGNRKAEANVLNDLGELVSRSAESQQALDHHTEALAIAREISNPLTEARALEGIGNCHLQDGDDGAGVGCLQQALAIYQQIGAPAARRVQEKLSRHAVASAPPDRTS